MRQGRSGHVIATSPRRLCPVVQPPAAGGARGAGERTPSRPGAAPGGAVRRHAEQAPRAGTAAPPGRPAGASTSTSRGPQDEMTHQQENHQADDPTTSHRSPVDSAARCAQCSPCLPFARPLTGLSPAVLPPPAPALRDAARRRRRVLPSSLPLPRIPCVAPSRCRSVVLSFRCSFLFCFSIHPGPCFCSVPAL